METEISKDIRQYSETIYFGLTMRQLICLGCGLALSGMAVWLMHGKVSTNIITWVVFVIMIPFAAIGFIKVNGQPFERFAISWIKFNFVDGREIKFVSNDLMLNLMKENIEALEDSKKKKEIEKRNKKEAAKDKGKNKIKTNEKKDYNKVLSEYKEEKKEKPQRKPVSIPTEWDVMNEHNIEARYSQGNRSEPERHENEADSVIKRLNSDVRQNRNISADNVRREVAPIRSSGAQSITQQRTLYSNRQYKNDMSRQGVYKPAAESGINNTQIKGENQAKLDGNLKRSVNVEQPQKNNTNNTNYNYQKTRSQEERSARNREERLHGMRSSVSKNERVQNQNMTNNRIIRETSEYTGKRLGK